jgi:hypothetical protein
MKLEFSRQIFEKCSRIKLHETPSIGSRVASGGQTRRISYLVYAMFRARPKIKEERRVNLRQKTIFCFDQSRNSEDMLVINFTLKHELGDETKDGSAVVRCVAEDKVLSRKQRTVSATLCLCIQKFL